MKLTKSLNDLTLCRFNMIILQRDEEFMKDTFKKVMMESVYPLINSATLPSYKSGDVENEKVHSHARPNNMFYSVHGSDSCVWASTFSCC